jgi:tetratricopeptide (TPR) repeat protein
VLDDQVWITQNPALRHLGLPGVAGIPGVTGVPGAGGRRLVSVYTLMLNYGVGGLHVEGYHAVNVSLHLLTGLVLWGLLRRTLRSPALRNGFAGVGDGLAAAVALLWLVHPLQTQAVDYTVQRMEVMMAMFYLLTLYAVARSAGAERGVRRWLWCAVAWVCCALGMLSKEVMIGAPLVAVVYDRVFFARSWREVFRRRWLLYLGLAVSWGLYPLLGLSELTAPASGGSLGFSFAPMSRAVYLGAQPAVIAHYLRLVFWPHPLVFDYGNGVLTGFELTAGCGVLLGLMLAATVWALWWRPAAGFAGLAFFLILAPTSSLVPLPDLCVEHRMYLPLAAVVALVVIGGWALWQRVAWRGGGRSVGIWCGAAGVVVAAVALGVVTWRRNIDYHTSLSLWQATVRDRPENARAHNNLGMAFDDAGLTEDAMDQQREALALQPNFVLALVDLGNDWRSEGQMDRAVECYRRAIAIDPDDALAHTDLGNALVEAGQSQEAIGQFEQALRLRPGAAEIHYNMANALMALGRTAPALEQYQQALMCDPDFVEAHGNLGVLLASKGDLEGAVDHLAAAARVNPDYMDNLLRLLIGPQSACGADRARAVALARRACDGAGHRNGACLGVLAAAYAADGQFPSAVEVGEDGFHRARAAGQKKLADQLEACVALYRAGKPYQPPVRAPGPR